MKKVMAAITLASLCFLSIPIYAKDAASTLLDSSNTVTKSYEIDVSDGGSYEKSDLFEKEIQDDNKSLILKDVDYKVIKEEPVYKDGTLKKSVKKVSDQKDYKADNTITEDGVTYTLKETAVKSTKTIQEASDQTVTENYDYDVYTEKTDVPEIVKVSTVDDVTGENVDVECTLQSFDEIQGSMVSVPIVYTGYDSDYYIYKGGEVQRNDISPALAAYESEILSDAGLDTRNAKITSITWNGEAYTDGNGELARNATANVAVTNYRAVYKGTIHHDEKKEYTYLLSYEGEGKQEVSGIKHVTVEATATYEPLEAAPVISPIVVVGIAIAILALLIVLILFVLSKKRKEKEEQYKNKV